MDDILQTLEEDESRISQREDENVDLRQIVDKNARKCDFTWNDKRMKFDDHWKVKEFLDKETTEPLTNWTSMKT